MKRDHWGSMHILYGLEDAQSHIVTLVCLFSTNKQNSKRHLMNVVFPVEYCPMSITKGFPSKSGSSSIGECMSWYLYSWTKDLLAPKSRFWIFAFLPFCDVCYVPFQGVREPSCMFLWALKLRILNKITHSMVWYLPIVMSPLPIFKYLPTVMSPLPWFKYLPIVMSS